MGGGGRCGSGEVWEWRGVGVERCGGEVWEWRGVGVERCVCVCVWGGGGGGGGGGDVFVRSGGDS